MRKQLDIPLGANSDPKSPAALPNCVCAFVSHNVFSKSLCSRQLHHKSVNSSITLTHTKNQLTDLCENQFLQTTFKTLCVR